MDGPTYGESLKIPRSPAGDSELMELLAEMGMIERIEQLRKLLRK
jgi:hypothetical protein